MSGFQPVWMNTWKNASRETSDADDELLMNKWTTSSCFNRSFTHLPLLVINSQDPTVSVMSASVFGCESFLQAPTLKCSSSTHHSFQTLCVLFLLNVTEGTELWGLRCHELQPKGLKSHCTHTHTHRYKHWHPSYILYLLKQKWLVSWLKWCHWLPKGLGAASVLQRLLSCGAHWLDWSWNVRVPCAH